MYHSIVGPDTFQPVGPSEELLGQWRCWQWQGPWTFGAIWFLCDNPTIQRLSICRASTYVSSFLCHYHLGFFKDLGYHDYILRLDDDAFLCIVTNYLQYLWYGERKILCLPMNSPITNIFQIGGSDDILLNMNFGSWYQLQHLQRLEGVQYRPWWSHVQFHGNIGHGWYQHFSLSASRTWAHVSLGRKFSSTTRPLAKWVRKWSWLYTLGFLMPLIPHGLGSK